MPEYTAGTWHWHLYHPADRGGRVQGIVRSRETGDGLVSDSLIADHITAPIDEEVEGNTRLIAAAPDLLQAAERVLGQYVRGEQIDMGQLSEAFKKAKGRGAALAALSRLLDESQ